ASFTVAARGVPRECAIRRDIPRRKCDMRSDWVLPAQREVPWSSSDRQVKNVLLEFDGPQLVVLSTPEGDQLALAVDEDDVVVRWLQAPISKLELSALLSGAQPIREVFKKPGLTVADYPHGFESPLTIYR